MSLKIAENLLFLRKQQGITQEALAEVLGVTSQSISKWELGINCPDISLLPEIASFYKISIDELLGYKPISSINSIYEIINEKSPFTIKGYIATIDKTNTTEYVDDVQVESEEKEENDEPKIININILDKKMFEEATKKRKLFKRK